MLLVRHIGSLAAEEHTGSWVIAPPWESNAELLPTALARHGVALDCLIGVAGDGASSGTSCRCMDLRRLAWPRPHSRPSPVYLLSGTRQRRGIEIENAHLLRLDIARR